jgi:hypothetical protein
MATECIADNSNVFLWIKFWNLDSLIYSNFERQWSKRIMNKRRQQLKVITSKSSRIRFALLCCLLSAAWILTKQKETELWHVYSYIHKSYLSYVFCIHRKQHSLSSVKVFFSTLSATVYEWVFTTLIWDRALDKASDKSNLET